MIKLIKIYVCLCAIFMQIPLCGQTPENKDSLYAESLRQAMDNIAQGNTSSAIFYLKECASIRPTEASVYYELARMYDRIADETQTIYYARKAYNMSPSNLWWEEYLLSSAIKYKKYDVAVYVMEKRYAREDRFLADLLTLYMATSSWDKILSTLAEYEKTHTLTHNQMQYRLQSYMEKKDYKTALKTAEIILKKYPDDVDAARNKLLAMHSLGKIEQGWKYFTSYYEQHPTDGRAAYTMLTRYNEQKDYPSLIQALDVIAGDTTMPAPSRIKIMELVLPVVVQDTASIVGYEKALHTLTLTAAEKYPETNAYVGDYYFAKKDRVQALKYYRKALHSGYLNMDMIQKLLYIESVNDDYMSIYTDMALAIASGVEDADVFTQHGLAAYRKGYIEEAIKSIERAAGMSRSISLETYGQLCSFLGTLYHEIGNDTRSDEYFETALSLVPHDASTLNNYAYFLALRKKDMERAMKMSRAALAQEPQNESYIDTYAYLLYLHGMYKEALDAMEKLMQINKTPSIEVLEHYRDILKAHGESGKAQEVDKRIMDMTSATEDQK